ncbi:bifunctional diguanylate cyclase/phosphodiesterase [Photobacterium gaetbulicola]|uniref:Sensory box/GGDEF family protein n=1 Tax=Photobacterium gaetbulicola Gung47 TaxID=658445 RepID=A0A0C5WPU6_9GAMM|nr:EAL domain-containing protein [Photobacterium gaetbulicola]AJR08357.1 hypothetical protein H744_2c1684 [Photobacterium gaetbulicola Gung47]PSU08971.1 bifunctional diguanylate cyclase/phosphodiesterase [Photobacterium gaetbulicola]
MMKIKNLVSAKLSTRTAILFGAALFAIAALCLLCARYFFLQNLNEIEQQHVIQHVEQAEKMIDIAVRQQLKRSFDWSYWDESYQLVKQGDAAYRERNLYYDGLQSLDIDLMVFLDLDGNVAESIYATEQDKTVPLPAQFRQRLLAPEGLGLKLAAEIEDEAVTGNAYAGLLRWGDDIMIVSVAPIRNSLGNGPVAGWLIWGRYLSEVFPGQYSDVLATRISLAAITSDANTPYPASAALQSDNSGEYLTASVILNDINGMPLAMLNSSHLRTIYQQGSQLISWLAMAMFVVAVVIGMLTLLAFRLKVGSRFLAFEKGLEALVRDRYSAQMKAEGSDEFSIIEEVINQTLTKSTHSNSALNDVVQKFDALYRTSNLGLLMVLDGQIVDANDTIAEILSYPSGQGLIGQSLLNLCPASSHQYCKVEALTQAVNGGQRHFDTELLASDGRVVACKLEVMPIKQQCGEALMFSIKDVSRQKEQEGLINQMERYDTVTGLLNRQTMLALLEDKLSSGQRSSCSVVYIRIERFSNIVGAFGHQMADEVLAAVAKQLKSMSGKGLLGRVAESEFAILLSDDNYFAPYRFAKVILSSLGKPFQVEGVELRLSASVGLVLLPTTTMSAEQAISAAEFATYCARTKKSRIQFFDSQIEQQLKSHIVIQRDIANAISQGDIYPDFQPIVNSKTEEVCGFEALARWHHPELGGISPEQFIPLAESRELIVALGSCILEKSCEFLAQVNSRRKELGLGALTVNVNLAGSHFSHPQLLPQLRTLLERYQISPKYLIIEITETMLIDSNPGVIQQMQAIKNLGIKLALDDFGTGYSALSSLCEFPLDIVKLDRSFVQRIGQETQSEILISSIVNMSKALELKMVAEGVETKEQKQTMQSLDVAAIQGFYFYRPMSAQAAMEVALQVCVEEAY